MKTAHGQKGRRFGALVHTLLASIDLDVDVDAIKAGAAIKGTRQIRVILCAKEPSFRASAFAVSQP